MNRLAGKRALITGAASGIGREISHQFQRDGAVLVLLDRDADGVAATAAELGVTGLRCDLRQPVEIETMVAAAIVTLGGLDIVVNAAGVLIRQPFESIGVEQWQMLFEVNLLGPALV